MSWGFGRSGSVQCGGREGTRSFAKLASLEVGLVHLRSWGGNLHVSQASEKPCGIRLPVLKNANLGQRKGGTSGKLFSHKGHILDRRLLQQYHILIRPSIYGSMHGTLSRACCHLWRKY